MKNLPAVQETRLRSLGREDPLEMGMATHSSTLAWRIPWTEEPGGLQFMEKQRVGHDCATTFLFFISINASVSAYVCLGFPGGTVVINLPDDTRDTGDVG